jgi:hypothetical protein
MLCGYIGFWYRLGEMEKSQILNKSIFDGFSLLTKTYDLWWGCIHTSVVDDSATLSSFMWQPVGPCDAHPSFPGNDTSLSCIDVDLASRMARFLSPREDGMTFRVPNSSNDGQILATDPHLEVTRPTSSLPGPSACGKCHLMASVFAFQVYKCKITLQRMIITILITTLINLVLIYLVGYVNLSKSVQINSI